MSEQAESAIVYTAYGYGVLAERRERDVVVKFNWGGTGYLNPGSVLESVPFTVKVFAGEKPELNFSWPVNQPFKQLYSELATKLALPPHMYSVLYYPKGSLRTILAADSPQSVGLKAHARLVVIRGVKRQRFAWKEDKKGGNLVLSNNKMTATKQAGDNYETVLGSLVLNSGRHYWEVTIDCFMEEEDFFIGVAAEGIPLRARPCDTNMFWGFVGSSAVKVGPEGFCEGYGDVVSSGDVVGVSLEYTDNQGSISFSKNGTDFGVAFAEVPANVLPALSLFYVQAQATLGFR